MRQAPTRIFWGEFLGVFVHVFKEMVSGTMGILGFLYVFQLDQTPKHDPVSPASVTVDDQQGQIHIFPKRCFFLIYTIYGPLSEDTIY